MERMRLSMENQNNRMSAPSVADQRTGDAWKSLTAGIFLVGLGAFLLAGCSGKKAEQSGPPPAPVTVETASRKSVPVQLRTMGNVEAFTTVGIKARLDGTLTRVHFTEGQDVQKGALLFSIDPRPFEAALRQSEATLARDRAQFENAQKDAGRYAELSRKGYVSQEQYEQLRTNADALSAVVQADLAQVENAKLQLGYCSIYAPVSGRTGGLLLHEGNLVKANADTPMVIINQIQPVNVTFTVPEKDLSEIRKYMASGKPGVEAFLSAEDKSPTRGSLSFIDNAVDKATGTIMMKASFPNQDRHLWPGQYVNVVMTLAVRNDATVVPSAAVQTSQQGQFVYVVKGDTAEFRPVTAGIEYGGLTVIEVGVAPDEQVVTDGQVRIVPGGKIAIKQPQGAGNNAQGPKSMGQNQQPEAPARDKVK
jgi:membrane fusion protein, multidrug efflux system